MSNLTGKFPSFAANASENPTEKLESRALEYSSMGLHVRLVFHANDAAVSKVIKYTVFIHE